MTFKRAKGATLTSSELGWGQPALVVLLRYVLSLPLRPFNTRKIATLVLFRAAGQLNLVSIEKEILRPQVQLVEMGNNKPRTPWPR